MCSTTSSVGIWYAAAEKALPGQRDAARRVVPAAHNTWAHFGGDSGGWYQHREYGWPYSEA